MREQQFTIKGPLHDPDTTIHVTETDTGHLSLTTVRYEGNGERVITSWLTRSEALTLADVIRSMAMRLPDHAS